MKECQYGNVILKIYRPELSDVERIKRENQIMIALQQFGKAMADSERN